MIFISAPILVSILSSLQSIFTCMAFISSSRSASILSFFVMWRYNYIMKSSI
jgi:hypothetical protein